MITKQLSIICMLILATVSFMLSACDNKKPSDNANQQVNETSSKYTCPMHPQIIRDSPGICPICRMELVLIDKTNTDNSLTLSKRQLELANIHTILVGQGSFSTSKVLSGRLVTDPQQTELVSSRIAGRVEKLFVKGTGIKLSKGQPLFQIFSEQLQVLQQDYLLQLKQVAAFPGEKVYPSLRDAAKNKLKLFGYSDAQIRSLASTGKVSPLLTVYAPSSGVVNEINISEGQYIAEGSPVIRLENFNSLWVEADVYPAEIDQVSVGSVLKVVINGLPELAQNAKVDFISPALNPSTQRLTIRAAINNSSGSFQPGMQADVFLSSGKVVKAVSLPLAAVIRDENGAYVWIKTKANTFTSRKVTTGAEDANQIVITSGIANGEEVVSSGAYLLHSEFVLKGNSI